MDCVGGKCTSSKLGLLLAVAASLVAGLALDVAMIFLVFGSEPGASNGWLFPLCNAIFDALDRVLGRLVAQYTLIAALALPGCAAAVLAFAWLTRGRRRAAGFLRCLCCGQILKGLSAPRCPECGEPI